MLIHRITSVHVVSVPSLKIKKLWRSECWNSMFFQAGSGILLAVPPKSSFLAKLSTIRFGGYVGVVIKGADWT